jgi:hypothetical protein
MKFLHLGKDGTKRMFSRGEKAGYFSTPFILTDKPIS